MERYGVNGKKLIGGMGLLAASSGFALVILLNQAALAQDVSIEFSVPSQPLAAALLSYAKQAGISIAVRRDVGADQQSLPIMGTYTQAEALRKLLAGTGLDFEFTDKNDVRVFKPILPIVFPVPSAPVAVPPVVRVQAQADQPSALSSGGLEEIIVTARRKEEKAQSVPISITNVTSAQMEEQRVLNTSDFTKDITGFSALTGGNRSLSGTAVSGGVPNAYQWIRGIPGVVPYWADAPTVFTAGLMFDISSAQVLKGPQGTLFGVATNGGALIFQPKLPTNAFEGFVDVEVGTFGHSALGGMVNVPIIDDKVLVRFGGKVIRTDGYIYDITHKAWLGSDNNQNGRLAVTIRPMDDIQNDFIANQFHYADAPEPAQIRYVNQPIYGGGTGFYSNIGAPGTCGVTPACLITYGGPLGFYAVPGDVAQPQAPFESGYWLNLVNTTRWDINDNLTVKNIMAYTEGGGGTSYSQNVHTVGLNPNWLGNPIISHPPGVAIQATDELQVLGKAFDDKLSFTAGAFKMYTSGSSAPHQAAAEVTCARVTNAAAGGVLAGGVPSSCAETITYANARTHAVYAQGTYDLSYFLDGLSFTGGVRYTWDRNWGSAYTYSGIPPAPGKLGATLGPAIAGWGQGEASQAASYNISVDWQMDSKTMIYFTNSQGYSRGGLVLVPTFPGPTRSYGPESLNNLEVGIKADWDLPLGMKARTNAAAFYAFYDNIQVPAILAVLDALGNLTSVSTTTNAANGHVQGVDFDLTLLPTDDIQLSFGGVEVTDRYDNYSYCTGYSSASTCINTVSYLRRPFVIIPRWTWHARAAYTLPVDESLGKVVIAANVNHIGPYYGSPINYPDPGYPASSIQNLSISTYNVDMSLNWSEFLGRTGLDARAYVNNLMNDHWGQGSAPSYVSPGTNTQPVARPRSWGLGVKYAFGP